MQVEVAVKKVNQWGDCGEASIMKQMAHVKIVSLIEVFDDAKGRYLILELCHNGCLGDIMEICGKQELASVRYAVAGITIALEHVHSRNILHCDVKPLNINVE